MSRNPRPTPAELEFVYGLILSGFSDRDIIEEYLRRDSNRTLEFPIRTDVRFVRERRKELAAAEAALGGDTARRADPVVSQARQRHFEELARAASEITGDQAWLDQQRLGKRDAALPPARLHLRMSDIEIANGLKRNFDDALANHRCHDKDFHNLASHLKSGEYLSVEGVKPTAALAAAMDRQPRDLLLVLLQLARMRLFEGSCPSCPRHGRRSTGG